jgi:hypothetical protein
LLKVYYQNENTVSIYNSRNYAACFGTSGWDFYLGNNKNTSGHKIGISYGKEENINSNQISSTPEF